MNRQNIVVNKLTLESTRNGTVISPEPWEKGVKDMVIAYPNQVTRIQATFSMTGGQYVWHCHIVEHEDNEMMRPYRVGPKQTGQAMSNYLLFTGTVAVTEEPRKLIRLIDFDVDGIFLGAEELAVPSSKYKQRRETRKRSRPEDDICMLRKAP